LTAVLLGFALAVAALPAAAKTMFYVPDGGYSQSGTWYAVLHSDGSSRLVTELGAKSGTYTDNGIEILVNLNKPLSYEYYSDGSDCNHTQYLQRKDIKQVLFRRVDGTNVNKGKSRVVEIGKIVNLDGCKAGQKTPFGNVADEGEPALHRSADKRDPMTDVVAGLKIAGFREAPKTDPLYYAEDVVSFDTDSSLHFQSNGHVVNANMTTDLWLVLQLPTFQRGYTRFSADTSNGVETWIEADFKDGKPQTVTSLWMTKPLPGASFGTKAATSRMWEDARWVDTNEPFFFYLYRDFTGDRVQKDISAGDEFRTAITWRYQGLDVVTSRTVGAGTLSERRWTPLGRTGKYMSVMEQEVRTPSGGASYLFIPPRVTFFIDRGAAYPPAP